MRSPESYTGWLHAALVRPFQSDTRHLDVLTGIRGWAALWVFLYHAWSLSGHSDLIVDVAGLSLDFTPLASVGGAGVTIFFVLSGFLLAIPFAEWQAGMRERPALGKYFLRRVARVFPAYYAQLAILLVIAAWVPGQPGIEDWGTLRRHLLMLFVTPPIGTLPINGVWWTLPIEFSFYLVLPLLAFLLRPQRWWLLLAGSLASMYLWRYGVTVRMMDASVSQRVIAAYQLPGWMDAFGFGMLASCFMNRSHLPHWLITRKEWGRLGIAGIVLVASQSTIAESETILGGQPDFHLWTPHWCWVLPRSSLRESGKLAGQSAVLKPLHDAGLVSYSYYLWHLPVLRWIVETDWFRSLESMRFCPCFCSAPLVFIILRCPMS
jgi:peptidoglycan/LPS O-acetylase OafA/YrhL